MKPSLAVFSTQKCKRHCFTNVFLGNVKAISTLCGTPEHVHTIFNVCQAAIGQRNLQRRQAAVGTSIISYDCNMQLSSVIDSRAVVKRNYKSLAKFGNRTKGGQPGPHNDLQGTLLCRLQTTSQWLDKGPDIGASNCAILAEDILHLSSMRVFPFEKPHVLLLRIAFEQRLTRDDKRSMQGLGEARPASTDTSALTVQSAVSKQRSGHIRTTVAQNACDHQGTSFSLISAGKFRT